MATIITYDIPSKHSEFKNEMVKLGYKDRIADPTCTVIYFPNTTLYHPTKNAVAARDDARIIAKRLDVKLERCIATLWENWAAICVEPLK